MPAPGEKLFPKQAQAPAENFGGHQGEVVQHHHYELEEGTSAKGEDELRRRWIGEIF